MTERTTLRAAFRSDAGLERGHNEDAFFCDPARGLFAVIDGVGGQNAGERAAAIARDELLARLSRPDGTIPQALREGITIANNKIFQQAHSQEALRGMACVLSALVIDDEKLYIGHVGDSRVYLLQGDTITKLTHDHSPVGEREDRGELHELEAMRHPRRNEVYRDVGSERHQPDDRDFIELIEAPFSSSSALVLCSDGLTDLVASGQVLEVVCQLAGDPQAAADRLLELALQQGGKDNVTVIVVEGPDFADSQEDDEDEATTRRLGPGLRKKPSRHLGLVPPLVVRTAESAAERASDAALPRNQDEAGTGTADGIDGPLSDEERTGRIIPLPSARKKGHIAQEPEPLPLRPGELERANPKPERPELQPGRAYLPGWLLPLLGGLLLGALLMLVPIVLLWPENPPPRPAFDPAPLSAIPRVKVLEPGASLRDALAASEEGTLLIIPPGEYNEDIALRSGVSLVAARPGTVVLEPLQGVRQAIIAEGVERAGLYGLVVGSDESPLPVGILLKDSQITLVDVEVRGTTQTGLELRGSSRPLLYGVHFFHKSGTDLEAEPPSTSPIHIEWSAPVRAPGPEPTAVPGEPRSPGKKPVPREGQPGPSGR